MHNKLFLLKSNLFTLNYSDDEDEEGGDEDKVDDIPEVKISTYFFLKSQKEMELVTVAIGPST